MCEGWRIEKLAVGFCCWVHMEWRINLSCEESVSECEIANWLVEILTSGKVGESGWKIVNWMVESISCVKVNESARKFINCLAETIWKNRIKSSG